MADISTFLNFKDCTEEAFNFYKSVFNGEFIGDIMRYGDAPPNESHPTPAQVKNMVMHAAIKILGNYVLHGADSPEIMGFKITFGNNITMNINPDSREESKRIFNELSKGGEIRTPLEDTFWGAYYGDFTDKFGVKWMINYEQK
ncbi:MAG: VOC family protein [Spirochaetales bacterium]|nr:VOC family protein [Spirochaetales bacterium]